MDYNSEIIQKLAQCAAACEICMDSCLSEHDVQDMIECIRTDRDCARICTVTASFIASNSPFAGQMLKICEDICERCAQECEKHDMDHCQQCARACRECLEACRAYEMHYA